LKPDGQSISAYVRGLIEREHRARELRAAATAYLWEAAPLVDDVESGTP
jgi:hypothetical protein